MVVHFYPSVNLFIDIGKKPTYKKTLLGLRP